MKSVHKRRSVGAVLAAVALAAPLACGDDDSATTVPATDSSSGAQSPTGETPIRIGVIYDNTNAAVPHPEIPAGAQAAIDFVNAQGGVNGHPLELVECDGQTSPAVSADCGREMVGSDVVAVTGMYAQNDGQIVPILEDAKIPIIGNISTQGPGLTASNVFPVASAGVLGTYATGRALVDQGAHSIVIAYIDAGSGRITAERTKEQLQSYRPSLEVSTVPVKLGATDMTSFVQAALNSEPDGIVPVLPRDENINFAQTLRAVDTDVMLAVYGGDLNLLIDGLGDAAEGLVTVGSFNDGPATPNADAGTRFQDAMADADASAQEYSAHTYASVLVFAKVAMGLPEVTSAAIFDKLPTVSNLDPFGFMPPLQFEASSPDVPDARVFNACYNVRQVTDGVLKALDDDYIDVLTGERC